MKKISIALLIFFLTGCGTYHRNKAAFDLEEAKDAYKQCIQEKGAKNCEKEKLLFETELESYKATKKNKFEINEN